MGMAFVIFINIKEHTYTNKSQSAYAQTSVICSGHKFLDANNCNAMSITMISFITSVPGVKRT